jgi:hypothetical protein
MHLKGYCRGARVTYAALQSRLLETAKLAAEDRGLRPGNGQAAGSQLSSFGIHQRHSHRIVSVKGVAQPELKSQSFVKHR